MTTPQPNFKGRQACKDQDWPIIPPRERTDMSKQEYDEKVGEQKAVCAGCPVKSQCLAYALKVRVQGVWGRTTDKERAAFRRNQGIVPEELPTVEDYLPRPELIPVVCSEMGVGCKSRKGGRLRAAVPGDDWDPCPCGGKLVRVVNYMPSKPRRPRRSQAEVLATFKRCGENNGKAKMTEEKVRELRRLHEAGVKTKDLAAKYGIGRGVAYNIAVRRSWKQVA